MYKLNDVSPQFELFLLQGKNHLTVPLLAMVCELSRRQQELIKVIMTKDKEIDDLKSQGAKHSRSKLQGAKHSRSKLQGAKHSQS